MSCIVRSAHDMHSFKFGFRFFRWSPFTISFHHSQRRYLCHWAQMSGFHPPLCLTCTTPFSPASCLPLQDSQFVLSCSDRLFHITTAGPYPSPPESWVDTLVPPPGKKDEQTLILCLNFPWHYSSGAVLITIFIHLTQIRSVFFWMVVISACSWPSDQAIAASFSENSIPR